MEPYDNYFYLGKITKVHAYDGKLVLYFDTDEPEKYATLQTVFVADQQGLIPFFIEEIKLKNQKAIVKIQDIDTLEKASQMVGKALYLPMDQLPPLTGNKFYYHEVTGFAVIDRDFGLIGNVNEILEYPNQAVIQVFYKEKEVLIPVNDEVILSVDRVKKVLNVQMPEGLLAVYLEESGSEGTKGRRDEGTKGRRVKKRQKIKGKR